MKYIKTVVYSNWAYSWNLQLLCNLVGCCRKLKKLTKSACPTTTVCKNVCEWAHIFAKISITNFQWLTPKGQQTRTLQLLNFHTCTLPFYLGIRSKVISWNKPITMFTTYKQNTEKNNIPASKWQPNFMYLL